MARHIFLFLLGIILFASCEKQNPVEDKDFFKISEFAVSAAEASEYALDFLNSTSSLKSGTKREVKRTKEMKTPFGDKIVFVVEFESGGIVLMSDNLLNFPVLAFSDRNTWKFESFSDMAPAANEWLMRTIRLNLEIESDTVLQRLNNTIAMWNKIDINPNGLKSIDPDECIDEYIGIDENIYDNSILSAHWRQGNPFNACLADPNSSCDYPVGCGPIAAGQIMYFWEHPNYIDWINIDPVYPIYSSEDCASPIAQLMITLAEQTGTSNKCDYGMTFPNELVDGIKAMGYNAEKDDYDYGLVKQNIVAGHPVIIKGADNLFSQHYWVCDGYREIKDVWSATCVFPSGPVTHTWTTNNRAFVHLNWGWGDPSQNIWYGFNDITRPEGSSKDYDRYMKLIHNIYPN